MNKLVKDVLVSGALAVVGLMGLNACESDDEKEIYDMVVTPGSFDQLSPAGADYTVSVDMFKGGKWAYDIAYEGTGVTGWITEKAKSLYDITFTVAPNKGFARKAIVTFKDKEGKAESMQLTVSQQETNVHDLTVSLKEIEVFYDGGEQTVQVTASVTVDWECTAVDKDGKKSDWITVKNKTAAGATIAFAANEGMPRQATLLFTDKNKKAKEVRVPVVQAQYRTPEEPIPAGYVQTGSMTPDKTLLGSEWKVVNDYMKKYGWEYTEHPNQPKSTDTGEDVDGKHIEVVQDLVLGQPVFRFMVHKNEQMIDGDRGEKKDRQRNEMKTRVVSSNKAQYKDVNGNYDEWQIVEWKFKIPAGFQPSTSFTHIYQLKGHDGSNISAPIITLSLRSNADGSNRRVQVIHNGRSTATHQGTLVDNVPMSDFEGEWVQARTESHFCRDGYYGIKLTRISDGKVLMDYTNEHIDMWRDKGTTNVRSKHGIYRNVGKNPFGSNALLKDEELYLTDFKIYEKKSNDNPQAVDD